MFLYGICPTLLVMAIFTSDTTLLATLEHNATFCIFDRLTQLSSTIEFFTFAVFVRLIDYVSAIAIF